VGARSLQAWVPCVRYPGLALVGAGPSAAAGAACLCHASRALMCRSSASICCHWWAVPTPSPAALPSSPSAAVPARAAPATAAAPLQAAPPSGAAPWRLRRQPPPRCPPASLALCPPPRDCFALLSATAGSDAGMPSLQPPARSPSPPPTHGAQNKRLTCLFSGCRTLLPCKQSGSSRGQRWWPTCPSTCPCWRRSFVTLGLAGFWGGGGGGGGGGDSVPPGRGWWVIGGQWPMGGGGGRWDGRW
jgi:hypothetical protein